MPLRYHIIVNPIPALLTLRLRKLPLPRVDWRSSSHLYVCFSYPLRFYYLFHPSCQESSLVHNLDLAFDTAIRSHIPIPTATVLLLQMMDTPQLTCLQIWSEEQSIGRSGLLMNAFVSFSFAYLSFRFTVFLFLWEARNKEVKSNEVIRVNY